MSVRVDGRGETGQGRAEQARAGQVMAKSPPGWYKVRIGPLRCKDSSSSFFKVL